MLPAVLIFLALASAGVAMFLAIGTTAAYLFLTHDISLAAYVQVLCDQMNSGTLMAVPLFVIAATFMTRGGLARLIIDAAKSWIGGMHGGLALVAIIATTIFAAI